MKIELDQFEILLALEDYVEKKYGMQADFTDNSYCTPEIKYYVPNYVYRKTRDGKIKTNKFGTPVINRNKTTYKKEYLPFNDDCSISLYLESEY